VSRERCKSQLLSYTINGFEYFLMKMEFDILQNIIIIRCHCNDSGNFLFKTNRVQIESKFKYNRLSVYLSTNVIVYTRNLVN